MKKESIYDIAFLSGFIMSLLYLSNFLYKYFYFDYFKIDIKFISISLEDLIIQSLFIIFAIICFFLSNYFLDVLISKKLSNLLLKIQGIRFFLGVFLFFSYTGLHHLIILILIIALINNISFYLMKIKNKKSYEEQIKIENNFTKKAINYEFNFFKFDFIVIFKYALSISILISLARFKQIKNTKFPIIFENNNIKKIIVEKQKDFIIIKKYDIKNKNFLAGYQIIFFSNIEKIDVLKNQKIKEL